MYGRKQRRRSIKLREEKERWGMTEIRKVGKEAIEEDKREERRKEVIQTGRKARGAEKKKYKPQMTHRRKQGKREQEQRR